MKILDCENTDTMFKSIENITGLQKNELIKMFDLFDLDEFYKNNDWISADELFLNKIKQMRKLSHFHYDLTVWFHLTRTIPNNQFNEGLLPLNLVLENLWEFMFSLQSDLLSKNNWTNFRSLLETDNSLDSAFQYQLKFKDNLHWGPYAMLIREVAFNSNEIKNHDYLDVPEIIEDICNPFFEKYEFDLLDRFRQATTPCIIKFKTAFSDEEHLGIVINFLYHKHRNIELNMDCNTCFDGEGKIVPFESILKIEYL